MASRRNVFSLILLSALLPHTFAEDPVTFRVSETASNTIAQDQSEAVQVAGASTGAADAGLPSAAQTLRGKAVVNTVFRPNRGQGVSSAVSETTNPGVSSAGAETTNPEGGPVTLEPPPVRRGYRKQRRGGPSHKGKVWRKRANDSELAVATNRINSMVAALTQKNTYSTFLAYLNSTGLNKNLYNLLPYFNVTLLVPNDAAYGRLTWTAAQSAEIARSATWKLQLAAFHVVFPAFNSSALSQVIPGTQFVTADYPQAGIVLYRLQTPTPQFDGRANDATGASLIEPDMYSDSLAGKTQLIVHGIDKVMVPDRFFRK